MSGFWAGLIIWQRVLKLLRGGQVLSHLELLVEAEDSEGGVEVPLLPLSVVHPEVSGAFGLKILPISPFISSIQTNLFSLNFLNTIQFIAAKQCQSFELIFIGEKSLNVGF